MERNGSLQPPFKTSAMSLFLATSSSSIWGSLCLTVWTLEVGVCPLPLRLQLQHPCRLQLSLLHLPVLRLPLRQLRPLQLPVCGLFNQVIGRGQCKLLAREFRLPMEVGLQSLLLKGRLSTFWEMCKAVISLPSKMKATPLLLAQARLHEEDQNSLTLPGQQAKLESTCTTVLRMQGS